MGIGADTIKRIARFSGEVIAETLWPTRCALCDMPGAVLCEECARKLPHVDWWRACPRCGSPIGLRQCVLCNPVSLGLLGRKKVPFSGCASAVEFDSETGELVRVFKDQGERRLAPILAKHMAPMVPPAWRFDAVTFVPATKAAERRRGYDHGELLAREVAALLGVECVPVFERPKTSDQRALSARERVVNLNDNFKALPDAAAERRMIIVDDVFTTGATLCAATDAALAAGARDVYALTFARV